MPDAADTDKILPLQEWLKLLASNGVPMRLGMQLAAKGYKEYNTREKLSTLKSGTIDSWVEDKDQRKLVVAAVRNISAGKVGEFEDVLTIGDDEEAVEGCGLDVPSQA